MSGSTCPPSADPSDLHAIVHVPADLSELEPTGLALTPAQDGDTDSTDTWSTRAGSVSSASGQELAEAIQSSSILPSIGDIAVENSSEVYIGSNTHFHGAVTLLVPPSSLPGLLPPAVQGRSALTEKQKQADDHQQPPSTPTAESREQPARKKRWIERLQARYAVPILGSTVVFVVMVMIAVMVSRDEDKRTPSTPHNSPTSLTSATTPTHFPTTATQGSSTSTTMCLSCSHSDTSPEPTHPSFAPITREEWGADPPSGHIDRLVLPVNILVVQHTGRGSCFTASACASVTRAIQVFHMRDCSWMDIGYNFLVGGDGSVLEGRGWTRQGAHTGGWNPTSIGVGLIGNFAGEPSPTEAQRLALGLLGSQGVSAGALSDDYQVVGACQLKGTDSPGTVGMRWLRTVDHWSNYTTQSARCSVAVEQNELLSAHPEKGYSDCNTHPNQNN